MSLCLSAVSSCLICSVLCDLQCHLAPHFPQQMLRTCSLPDLSKLFRTFEDCQGLNGVVAAEDNLDLDDIRPMKVEEHAEIEDM